MDASWIGRRGVTSPCAVSYTIEVIVALCAASFNIIVVFDPPTRHHSKVASIKRTGERETARINAYHGRVETMRISEQLQTADLTADDRTALEKERDKLQSKVKTAENKASNLLLPADFCSRVEEEISKLDLSNYGDVFIRCETGKFQADSRIAKMVQRGEAQLILANDADFSFFLGGRCLQIVEFKKDSKKEQLKDLVVKSGYKSVIVDVVESSGGTISASDVSVPE